MTKRRIIIKKFKSILFDVVTIYEGKKNNRGRKNKFSLWYYIKYIVKVLLHGYSWNSLECTCDPSTIKKKFYKWRDNNIFYITYTLLLDYYLEVSKPINLYIDSTVIQNRNLNEGISYSYKIKGKKCTKINTIVTDDYITIAHEISAPKSHDVKYIEILVDKVKNKIVHSYHKPLYTIGDKGYTDKQSKNKLSKENIRLIYPPKKNAKNKIISKKNKQKLKNRFKVESSYSHLKNRYKRITFPLDKQLKSYNTFFIIGCICDYINYFSKNRLFSKIKKIVNENIPKYIK